MSAICKPNCVTALPNFGAIDDCDITKRLTSGEIAKVVFVKCNMEVTDIDDDLEWETNISNGLVTIPFVGNGKIDEQSEAGEMRIGCQTVSTICNKPFEFSSPIVDTDAETEWSLYNDIQKSKLGLTVLFITCDGIVLINPDWVSGQNPGLPFSKLKISQIFTGEADSKMMYKINGEISECRSLKRVKLSTETLEILSSTNTGS